MSAATLTRVGAREAVSYERISRFRVKQRDVDTELSRGVDRQWATAQKAAGSLGVELGERFTDNNRSASKYRQREREAFAALLLAIHAGRVSHVFVWLLDRIVRTTEDLDVLLDACELAGTVIVQSATGTVIDPRNPESVLHAKISGAVAEYEAAKMSMRQLNKKADEAKTGRPHGGRRRFGYEPGMLPGELVHEDGTKSAHDGIRTDEADVIREVVAAVIGGATLASQVRMLNARGITTSEGGQWTGGTLGAMLKRAHLAGLRSHKGELYPAKWRAIITEARREQLLAVLGNPERRTHAGANTRKYLLAGVAKCGVCGEVVRGRPMYSSRRDTNGKRATIGRAYVCITGAHVYAPIADVDRAVEEIIVRRLERADTVGRVVPDEDSSQLAALNASAERFRTRLDQIDSDWSAGEISDRTANSRTAKVEEELAAVEAELAELTRSTVTPKQALTGMTGKGARAAWAATADDMGRRAVVVGTLCAVEILPSGRGRKRSDDPADMFRLTWREPSA